MPTTSEVKKALVAAGFEVYCTRGDVVHLADRVRENLLMDASVFVRVTPANLVVGAVLRAQRSDFPNEDEATLFLRARALTEAAIERGYVEAISGVRRVPDPSDSQRTLDLWCEVQVEIPAAGVEAALDELRFALSLEKAASPRP